MIYLLIKNALFFHYAKAEGLAGVVPQTYLVGDCRRARVIKDAVFEGYSAAASI